MRRRFPGSQPVSFDRESLELLEREECVLPPFSLLNRGELTRRQFLGVREVGWGARARYDR